MPTIAAHTLGCKVNQYDTQAMLELFQEAGYQVVPMAQEADVYLINTCTVTETGDRKSLQLARKIRREHPGSRLILCGCLAQKQGAALLEAVEADLVIGVQRRSEVVALLRQTEENRKPLCAVEPLSGDIPYEALDISFQSEHTRATLKIQEGCDNRCTYCIIPSVRGPVRSRPPESIRREAACLAAKGYREVVLTGIHLSSYGRDLAGGLGLLDAVRIVQETEGILRIRLGSLEPRIATEDFARALRAFDKVCPQFHLALQSGSDTVLRRMKRQYNAAQYLEGVRHLREAFPDAAFTTDVLTGFPGETEAEYQETREMIRKVGFARIHVFPYSARPDTPAATMPGQLSRAEKDRRTRELIALGKESAEAYERSWLNRDAILLPEEAAEGRWEGYTPEYIRVRLPAGVEATCGTPVRIKLVSVHPGYMDGEIIE